MTADPWDWRCDLSRDEMDLLRGDDIHAFDISGERENDKPGRHL